LGCRFLIVDAKPAAEEFYLKKGFKTLKDHNSKPEQYISIYFLGNRPIPPSQSLNRHHPRSLLRGAIFASALRWVLCIRQEQLYLL
jgi:hypothetical protein